MDIESELESETCDDFDSLDMSGTEKIDACGSSLQGTKDSRLRTDSITTVS
jgi:hypothetical protein